MTSRQRLLSLLRGEPTDRVAVYTQIPFALTEGGLKPGAFHGYADYDNWRENDKIYCDIVSRMANECDNAFIWRPPCMQNLQFFAPIAATRELASRQVGERVRFETEVRAGAKVLREVREVRPGTGHSWQIEHLCKSPDDARALIETDWEGVPAESGDFHEIESLLGDRGVMWVTIPSPLMVVCRLFDPMEFLMFVRSEKSLIDELMDIAARRIGTNLERLIESGVGPVIRFGGAEHATPPLMSPDDFDHLVVEYDAPLVELCRSKGRYVAYHCHGNLRHALRRFREMGVRQVDPTETVPDGDVSLKEARAIAGREVILAGNVQCREIFSDSVGVDVIRRRVRSVIDEAGPDNIIVTTTGTVLEPMSVTTGKKYHALIDEALNG